MPERVGKLAGYFYTINTFYIDVGGLRHTHVWHNTQDTPHPLTQIAFCRTANSPLSL